MYRNILVPLDGSARAEKILPHVEEMAARFGSRVILLQVVEPIVTVSSADIYIPLSEPFAVKQDQALAYLNGIQERLKEKGIETDSRLASGTVVDAICETAESERVDLIAMASHGRTGAARVFYGSVAAGVLRCVDRPLLIIRAQGN